MEDIAKKVGKDITKLSMLKVKSLTSDIIQNKMIGKHSLLLKLICYTYFNIEFLERVIEIEEKEALEEKKENEEEKKEAKEIPKVNVKLMEKLFKKKNQLNLPKKISGSIKDSKA